LGNDTVAGEGQAVLHEETGVHFEASRDKCVADSTGVVEEKLGFDAAYAWRVLQELEELMQELLGDVKHLRRIVCNCEGIANYGLLPFIDAEGEAADAPAVERDEAGQDTGVEILKEKLGGALIVPAEALFPEARLGFKQRAQLARGEVTKVQDLELGRYGHTLWKCSFELIGIFEGWVRDERGEYRVAYSFA
jgi:hypothetical protein